MSLKITSNTSAKDLPSQSQIFKPYSYQNNLTNTLRIPPYSEIALQSTKIQKSGEFILSRENGNFFHYFGVPLGGDDSEKARLNATYATSIPMMGICGDPADFALGARQAVSVNGFIGKIQYGMDHSAFHPNLVEGYVGGAGEVDSSWLVTTKRNAGVDFLGWNWVGTQLVAKTTENATYNWVDLTTQQTHPFVAVGNEVSTETPNGYIVQDRRRPVALNNGHANFDISGGGTAGWGVGLSRINPETSPDGDVRFHPTFYNSDYGEIAVFNKAAGRIYADIMVMRVGDNIRLYQSATTSNADAVNDGRRDAADILMKEITYYGAFNDDFNVIYDISANARGYSEVRFKIENEEMKVFLWGMMQGEDLLCDFTTIEGNDGGKHNVTYPVHQAKWNLYPTMYCRGNGNHLQLLEYTYQTNYPVYDADNFHKWDFQENLRRRGLADNYYPESNFWNDTSDDESGLNADGLLKPAIIDGGGKFEDFENILITVPSNLYGYAWRMDVGDADMEIGGWDHPPTVTANANTNELFGFKGRGIARPNTVAAGVCTLFSDEVPHLESDVSLFIRLNNFTQSSVNAVKGTTSKIVGHLPRFDNSGNDTGALYFEPHEKTYLALNNPDELVINSFDVDVVYNDERLCKALTGKTIVCFHIRQSPNLRF